MQILKVFGVLVSTGLLFGASKLGSVTGSAIDSSGTPIPGIKVLIECRHCKTPVAETLTGSNGGYLFLNIRPGTYSLRFKVSDLGEKLLSNVTVKPGRSTSTGRFILGIGCSAPGTNCDDFSYMRREFRLPCTIGLDMIKNELGQTRVFTWEEL